MKIQLKTTLILFSALLFIIGLFYFIISFSLSNYEYEDFYRLLEIRAKTTAKTEIDKGGSYTDIRSEFFDQLPHERDFIFEVSSKKTFRFEADSLKIPTHFFTKIMLEGKARFNKDSFFYSGIKYIQEDKTFIVIASAENYFDYHHAIYLKNATFFALVSSLIFSIVISIFLSKYIFKPLTKITEQVKLISSEHLHLRLELKNNNDEMDHLAATFNDMLNRIETAFESQNNFISNASHELRTPLTSIIGFADVSLSKERAVDDYIETIKIILEEAEKLDRKTKALLFLAQTGFNGKSMKFKLVRMDQLLWDVKETVEKINPESQIFIDTSLMPENPKKLKIQGNEQLLHLAFSNIVSNGCKYSDYKTVTVSIGVSDKHIIIVVTDQGIGIPSNEMPYIYDPFFRASNTKNYEGYGIGLPLTRNIIKIHQGQILVSSEENQGTIVQIKLPIASIIQEKSLF